MKATTVVVAVLLIGAALAAPAHADSFRYILIPPGDTGPYPCSEGDFMMFGVFDFDTPAKGVEFSAPLPPCIFSYVTDGLHYPGTGDVETGVTVMFDSCLTGVVTVFTRSGWVDHPCANGCIYGLGGEGTPPMVIGCDDVARELDVDISCPGAGAPYNLQPVAGATGVSVNPTLSWMWEWPSTCQEEPGLTMYTVYLGTDPNDLPWVAWHDDVNRKSTTEGPLEPNTLYYWYVHVQDDFWTYPGSKRADSAMHTFTTGAVTPTQQTTWGRIKALYK
jgi:hypothetical protein